MCNDVRAMQADSQQLSHSGRPLISFEEAMQELSADERFRATVYAMNSLLISKGFYTAEEFELQFRQWVQKHHQR